jgi:hypothetical protein
MPDQAEDVVLGLAPAAAVKFDDAISPAPRRYLRLWLVPVARTRSSRHTGGSRSRRPIHALAGRVLCSRHTLVDLPATASFAASASPEASSQLGRKFGFPVANCPVAEYEAADQEHLRQISQGKLGA